MNNRSVGNDLWILKDVTVTLCFDILYHVSTLRFRSVVNQENTL